MSAGIKQFISLMLLFFWSFHSPYFVSYNRALASMESSHVVSYNGLIFATYAGRGLATHYDARIPSAHSRKIPLASRRFATYIARPFLEICFIYATSKRHQNKKVRSQAF